MYRVHLQLCDLRETNLSGAINTLPKNQEDLDLDWEVDPARLQMMEKLGGRLMLTLCMTRFLLE